MTSERLGWKQAISWRLLATPCRPYRPPTQSRLLLTSELAPTALGELAASLLWRHARVETGGWQCRGTIKGGRDHQGSMEGGWLHWGQPPKRGSCALAAGPTSPCACSTPPHGSRPYSCCLACLMGIECGNLGSSCWSITIVGSRRGGVEAPPGRRSLDDVIFNPDF